MTSRDERQATEDEFKNLVNLTGTQLENWLETDDSKQVGQKKNGGESTGHHMGNEILRILHKRKSDYTDDDYAAMDKVTGYIKRHLAQRPDGDVTDTPWRWSLMNWGHDPLKD